jgi:hypothetical protein
VPQLALSVCTFVHTVPQRLGVADGQVQVPAWQLCAAGQTLPQMPQLLGSDESVVQLPLQLAWPVAQPVAQA